MPLSKEKIISHYNLFKEIAAKHFANDRLGKAAKYIGVSAYIAYTYKFRYTDDELENYIEKISEKLIIESPDFVPIQGRIVFYDSFAEDNRALTQQYIRAIFSWDYELLYITPRNIIDNDILSELNNYKKAKIIKSSRNSCSFNDQVIKTIEEINNFKPQFALLHFKPWDVTGICIWTAFKNVERYFINLTDDAFWLGKCCSDYYLEFRRFGASLSLKSRIIPIEKLLLQPYYPIQAETSFKGFPIEKKSNIFVFSGANFYKIYGNNGTFLDLIKIILKKYQNLIFLYAGDGDKKPFEKFIKKNGLEKQIYLIGPRKDINHVFKNIDIFINTFPVSGGLMVQLAALNRKPIISYSNSELYAFNDIDDLLETKKPGLLIKRETEDFLKYFDLLMTDPIEIKKNIDTTSECIITPKNFNELLLQNIMLKKCIDTSYIKDTNIDEEAIFNLFLEMENDSLKNHYSILWFVGIDLIFDSFYLGLKVSILKVLSIMRSYIYAKIKSFNILELRN